MTCTVAITFKSIEVAELQLRGEPDDYALSTLRLDLAYSNGREERDLLVQVWHALGPASGGIVRIITAIGHRDPICQPQVARSIEHFYRQRMSAEVAPPQVMARARAADAIAREPTSPRRSELEAAAPPPIS